MICILHQYTQKNIDTYAYAFEFKNVYFYFKKGKTLKIILRKKL